MIAGAILFAWLLRSFVIQPFYIPSASMLPTLYIGDYLVVAKWPYGYSQQSFPLGVPRFEGRYFAALPRRGDVVVFHHPSENADLIKRVIGLPGDIVEVRRGMLILNGSSVARQPAPDVQIPVSPNGPCSSESSEAAISGRALAHPSCAYRAFTETLRDGTSYTIITQPGRGIEADFPATRVPEEHVFVLGDNRDDSLDSRFPTAEGGVGMLPVDRLIGRGLVTFWSTDGGASYSRPWTWLTSLRGERIGNVYKSKHK